MTLPEELTVLNTAASRKYLIDLTERVGWTFVTAAGAIAVAAGPAHWMELSMWKGAAAAGLAAAGALLKGLVARYIGNRNSASTARTV